jgi:hypothetical protein
VSGITFRVSEFRLTPDTRHPTPKRAAWFTAAIWCPCNDMLGKSAFAAERENASDDNERG